MRLPRVRFTFGRLMIAIASVAVLLAWLEIGVGLAVVGLSLVVIIPAAIASPGRRLEAASWGGSLQPVVVLFYLSATWATAWCVLGHCPRPSLDDPKFISPIVEVPYVMFAFSLFVGSVFCACIGLLLSVVCVLWRQKIGPIATLPFAWLAGYVILIKDPLGVLFWYFD